MQKQEYSLFARYYDEYMAHVEYDHWVDFILGRFTRHNGKSPDRILELACGTGNIASRLVRRGFEVEATDISEAMLTVARTKPFPARYSQADMLTPIKPDHYDLILILFDSINYLLDPDEISQLLDNIAAGLKSDGILIFDISTARNCKENFDGYINIEDNDSGFMIHESDFDQSNLLQINRITFFLPKGKLFQRFDEIHQQRIYPVLEILKRIKASRLEIVDLYRLTDGHEFSITKDEYGYADKVYNRIFFVLERGKC